MLDIKVCKICNQSASNQANKILTNGSVYHVQCFENLNSSIQEIRTRISNLRSELSEAERKIRQTETFTYKFKSFWGGKNIDEDFYKKKIDTINSQVQIAEIEISSIRTQLTSFFDYWHETPPDWEERRLLVREKAGNCCQKCMSSGGETHVHHIIPVSRGGSHRLENLEYLCVNCHSQAHRGRSVTTENKQFVTVNRPVFSDRLELIKHAINKNEIISFNYSKYSGEKSKRSIKPTGLKQKGKSLCVTGHCYLRNEERIFAIKRMTGVKLQNQPGRSFDN